MEPVLDAIGGLVCEGRGVNRDLNILVGAVGLSALGDWLAVVPLSIERPAAIEVPA